MVSGPKPVPQPMPAHPQDRGPIMDPWGRQGQAPGAEEMWELLQGDIRGA